MAITKVTANVLADNAVSASSIADGAIAAAKIADDAVTTAKITDANITTAKLADDNVTFDKLENRYTAKSTTSSTSGTVSIDWSAGTTFEFTASNRCTNNYT